MRNAVSSASRVAHLATAGRDGAPHLVPVCFCLDHYRLHHCRRKAQTPGHPPEAIRNIQENPSVAVTVDRWDEDWTRLAWIMLRGRADILADGDEHDRAQHQLRQRYPQYRAMNLAPLPVIAGADRARAVWGRARAANWGVSRGAAGRAVAAPRPNTPYGDTTLAPQIIHPPAVTAST